MESTEELEIPRNKSAFYKYNKNRDSGYGTHENSPATPNRQLQFNFDEDVIKENTVMDTDLLLEGGEMSDDCFEDPSDVTDKEVECALSPDREISVAIPIERPCAPLPSPNETGDNEIISETQHFTSFSFQRRLKQSHPKCYFRPVGRRTISTQTPNQHSQILQHAVSTLSDRFHPYLTPEEPIGRGTVHNRLRHNSDDYVPHDPLPDVVPMGRDRSISLPDVPAWDEARETEIGKELRRISDEFHFSYTPPRQARIEIRRTAGSFPGTWNFGFLWQSLRQLMTPSPSNNSSVNH